MIYGVDVASWQAYPDWGQLAREGHDFMLSKITGEGDYINPYAATNIARARPAGLIPGGYDWVEPQSGMTGEQAARDYLRVCDAMGLLATDFLVATDFETPAWASGPLGRSIEPFMRPYVLTLIEARHLLFYTGPYFLDETGARDWAWLDDPRIHFWEAAPGPGMLPDDAPWPGYPPFGPCAIHQHQWHATSGAVAGEFDRNRYRGTRDDLLVLARPLTRGGIVKEPEAGKADQYINERGELVAVINFGGEASEVLGVNYADVGGSVRNAKGEEFDRSLVGGVMQGWVKR